VSTPKFWLSVWTLITQSLRKGTSEFFFVHDRDTKTTSSGTTFSSFQSRADRHYARSRIKPFTLSSVDDDRANESCEEGFSDMDACGFSNMDAKKGEDVFQRLVSKIRKSQQTRRKIKGHRANCSLNHRKASRGAAQNKTHT